MIQGFFSRKVNRRIAEIVVDDNLVEAYMSNGIDLPFLKSGAVCFLREVDNNNRRTSYDLFSVYDKDTLVCVDSREPLIIAEMWCREKYNHDGDSLAYLYPDVKYMKLHGRTKTNKDVIIQVMGTSLKHDRLAYLPEIPSRSLIEKLENLIYQKRIGMDTRLMIVVCRDDVDGFFANDEVDSDFAELMEFAFDSEIPIDILRCSVSDNGMRADRIISNMNGI